MGKPRRKGEAWVLFKDVDDTVPSHLRTIEIVALFALCRSVCAVSESNHFMGQANSTPVRERIDQDQGLHRPGRLRQAKRISRDLLRTEPHNPDARANAPNVIDLYRKIVTAKIPLDIWCVCPAATSPNFILSFMFYAAFIKHRINTKTAECDSTCRNHTRPIQAIEIVALIAAHRPLLLFRVHRSLSWPHCHAHR